MLALHLELTVMVAAIFLSSRGRTGLMPDEGFDGVCAFIFLVLLRPAAIKSISTMLSCNQPPYPLANETHSTPNPRR